MVFFQIIFEEQIGSVDLFQAFFRMGMNCPPMGKLIRMPAFDQTSIGSVDALRVQVSIDLQYPEAIFDIHSIIYCKYRAVLQAGS